MQEKNEGLFWDRAGGLADGLEGLRDRRRYLTSQEVGTLEQVLGVPLLFSVKVNISREQIEHWTRRAEERVILIL